MSNKVISQHDSLETLFYVDPPYPHSTRNLNRGNAVYVYEMTDDGHRELAEQLKIAKGFVVISGYGCELYDEELYKDWHRVKKKHRADGAAARTEVLWINKRAWQMGTRLF